MNFQKLFDSRLSQFTLFHFLLIINPWNFRFVIFLINRWFFFKQLFRTVLLLENLSSLRKNLHFLFFFIFRIGEGFSMLRVTNRFILASFMKGATFLSGSGGESWLSLFNLRLFAPFWPFRLSAFYTFRLSTLDTERFYFI